MPDTPRDWRKFAEARLPGAAADVREELAQHLEQAYADAIARGGTDAEALAWAETRFADWRGLAREIDDSTRRARWTTGALSDLRQALRFFRFNPAFAATAVATLAFGIGGNTAIFTLADALSLRSLPYPEPDRLMSIETSWTAQREVEPWTSALDFFDLRTRAHSFTAMAAISPVWSDILTSGGSAERLETVYVSAGFFPILGVEPALGRAFTPQEDAGVNGKQVAVLSHAFWQRRFGGRRDILGSAINLNGAPVTIIGVLPRDFRYLGRPLAGTTADVSLWMPLAINQLVGTPREVRFLKVIGRLRPGVSPAAASAEVRGISQSLKALYPASNNDVATDAAPLAERIAGTHRVTALLLLGAVGFVLLMACANVASLLLARAAARQKDAAVRAALGASRYRILRQLLAEGLVLSVTGGTAGWLAAWIGARALAAAAPASLRPDGLQLDWRALGFTAAAVLICALVAGLPPAWTALRGNLQDALRQAGRGLTRGSHRLRSALVTLEVAAALALLAGAGLLIHSFARLLDVNPGFDAHNLYSFTTQFQEPVPAKRTAAYDRIRNALLSMRGVESVEAISRLPLAGSALGSSVLVEGREPANHGEGPGVQFRRCSPGYFTAMRIPLRAGRIFDTHDGLANLAVISESMRRQFWPNENPIGKRVKLGPDPASRSWTTIVGVVGDVRHYALDVDAPATVYVPDRLSPFSSPIFVIRTHPGVEGPLPTLAANVHSVDSSLPVYSTYSMETLIERSTAQRRFVMSLLSGFALAALLLAAVGVFGAVSQAVAQRTREIGLRMALGSSPGSAVAMVFRDGMRLALVGAVIGIAAAAGLTQLLRNLLFEVQPLDPASFAGAAVILLAFAALACYLPARRATRVDPLIALRSE
jgi:putative ABC transport system permease protein